MAELKPHEQRVIDEADDLEAKLESLRSFLGTDTFNNLYWEERTLLTRQLAFMESYLEVLDCRIKRF